MAQDSIDVVRSKVFEAYDDDTGYFYSEIPHRYNGYIDGMAWNTVLIGACRKIGDIELAVKAERYVQTIIDVADDARTYAPHQEDKSWKMSPNIPGYWYKEKPQSHAGPLGLKFAMDNGAQLNVPYYLQEKWRSSMKLTKIGWAFGYSVRYITALRQHINTMFTAYLAKGKKPPRSMRWMYEENPYYSYIGGKKCEIEYPDMHKMENKKKTKCKDVQHMKYTKPTTWIFRRDPYAKYEGTKGNLEYTPIARLAAEYLQRTL